MSLHLIGLGLGSEKDITIKGFETVKKTMKTIGIDKNKLEKFYEKPIKEADRETIEEGIDMILDYVKEKNIVAGILVVGDPFCATTHSDLFLRAVKKGLKVNVIHNASIVSAVGCCGLQVYRFGEIVSLPFFTENWRPYSFYEKIEINRKNNLHTLLLLDIKVKEKTVENMMKKKAIYEPPRFMDVKTAVEQLLEAEEKKLKGALDKKTKCFGLARIGLEDQRIISGFLSDFLEIDMGPPLHSFVICSEELHIIELEMFEYFKYK